MFLQIPTPAPGEIERWIISAVAVMAIIVLAKKLFVRKPSIEVEFVMKTEFLSFKESVESQLESVRDKVDARFLMIGEKLDEMKTEILNSGSRRGDAIHSRINDLEAGLARVDERTK